MQTWNFHLKFYTALALHFILLQYSKNDFISSIVSQQTGYCHRESEVRTVAVGDGVWWAVAGSELAVAVGVPVKWYFDKYSETEIDKVEVCY